MMSFGMPNDVDDMRFECHLHIDAGCQVRPCGIWVERVAEQAGAGLPPDTESYNFV